MHKDTPIFLNVGDMDLSSEGVRDFYWPVSFQEVNEVRDETVYPLVRLLREGLRREVRGSIELSIVAPWLVTEIMSVFQAEAFRARTGDHKVVNLPPNMPIWEASLAGRQPAPPLFFESLQNSFPPRRLSEVLQKPFRLMSSFAWKMKPLVLPEGPRPPHVTAFSYDPYLGVEMKRICTRRLTRSTLQKKIVCTRRGGIFSAHAASVDSEVVLGRHKFWFHPISSQMVKRKMKEGLDASLRHNLLQIVLDVFHAHGEVLPPWHVDYFDMVFCRGAATIGVHLERLMRRPEKLPAVLWTGTGGNIWDRMLRYAVRSNGGSVCGHSHSGGSEHVASAIIGFNEFPFIDRYAVYNSLQKQLTLCHADPALLFEGNLPQVIVPAALERREAAKARVEARKSSPRKVLNVMYVATSVYGRDRLNMAPAIPDPVAVDWQARLFFHLADWKYEILHKPHPESLLLPPAAFQEKFGVQRIDDRFEDIFAEVDLFIFDTQSTSTFPVALKTGIPMVFVDLNRFRWEPEAYEMLKRRCALVPAGFGKDNRIVIDWDELRAAIERAPGLAGNTELEETFFG